MNRLFTGIGRAYPKGYRKSIAKLLSYAGSESSGEEWLGKILAINLISLVLLNLALWILGLSGDTILVLIANAGLIIAMQVMAYFLPSFSGERRAREVEKVLPSFYQLLASYLRSGMTPYQALKSSSKKEFGLLKGELDIATSKALGTQSFTDSLLDISNRIKSESLQRSTELMVRSMDSGGSLARLLEESSANLIENRSLKRQIIASSRTYTVMVIFAVIIGAPLLLSISSIFNERLASLTSDIGGGIESVQGMDSSMLIGANSIDPEWLKVLAAVTVAVTALISSFLVGIISDGKEKYGLKYAIAFVPMSVIFFYAFLWLLGIFLGTA
jgi:Flp pilus assembly protein TadB